LSEKIFLSNNNPISGRWAIFEDDGVSAWLYLTSPNDNRPIADCWIYNRIPAPESTEINKYRNGPPPASSEYAAKSAFVSEVNENSVQIKWSTDGNAVSLIIDGIPYGYITSENKVGFCRNLKKDGPWGNMFEMENYDRLFL